MFGSPLSVQEAELGLAPSLGPGAGPSVVRGVRQPQAGYQVTPTMMTLIEEDVKLVMCFKS